MHNTIEKNQAVTVRSATVNDVALLLSFLKKKATFDRAVSSFQGTLQTSEDKIRRTIFSAFPFAHALFAEVSDRPVGFALYYFRYSSFAGQPSLWLDDLFVDENKRGQGAGTTLMNHLAAIAQANCCSHIGWTADIRNTNGMNFYAHLNAQVVDQQEHLCFWRWNHYGH